jgi:hypothetical protein
MTATTPHQDSPGLTATAAHGEVVLALIIIAMEVVALYGLCAYASRANLAA